MACFTWWLATFDGQHTSRLACHLALRLRMALAHYFPPREPSLASTADMALSPSTCSCTRRPVSSTEVIPHVRVSTELLHSMRGGQSLICAYEAGADFIGSIFEGAWAVRAGRRFSPWLPRFPPSSKLTTDAHMTCLISMSLFSSSSCSFTHPSVHILSNPTRKSQSSHAAPQHDTTPLPAPRERLTMEWKCLPRNTSSSISARNCSRCIPHLDPSSFTFAECLPRNASCPKCTQFCVNCIPRQEPFPFTLDECLYVFLFATIVAVLVFKTVERGLRQR